MSDSQIILGLDPGFGRLGFGFITASGGRLTALDYGIISTPADWTFAARLKQLGVDLEQLLSEHPPAVVGLEKLFFAKNAKTAMPVAEARGVISFICAKHNLPVHEFAPATVKNSLTGNGRADKPAMQWMVREILHLPAAPKLDDAADALALAICTAGVASLDNQAKTR